MGGREREKTEAWPLPLDSEPFKAWLQLSQLISWSWLLPGAQQTQASHGPGPQEWDCSRMGVVTGALSKEESSE